MSTSASPKARPRARKSIAHLPSPDVMAEKENTESALPLLGNRPKAAAKKARSKSLGPGGLDALKEGNGNQQKVLLPLIRSILKPTIPLSPPKPIPPRNATRPTSPRKGRPPSPKKQAQEDLLIDFSEPISHVGIEKIPNPFDDDTSQATPPAEAESAAAEEEKQAAKQREQERKAILERRDARRKSLANRRVSFAPEATLHTWDLVETGEDATTSSEATNSTRRASAMSNMTSSSSFPSSPRTAPSDDAAEPPSTPPEQVEEPLDMASPEHQRDLHQKKRRRSSGVPPMNFNNLDDFSSSPTSSTGGDDPTEQLAVSVDDDIASDSSADDDLVESESTMTGANIDDVTNHSIASASSAEGSSTSFSKRLNAALKQAAAQAGTRGIENDELGDQTMDLVNDELTGSFKPWGDKALQNQFNIKQSSASRDQENMNPFSPAFKANLQASKAQDDHEDDDEMDFTQAAGGILQIHSGKNSPKKSPRKSGTPVRRRSAGRRSSGASCSTADATMDLTTAIGGIQPIQDFHGQATEAADSVDENEDLTMEFTTALGGVMNPQRSPPKLTGADSSSLPAHELAAKRANEQLIESSIFDDDMMDETIAMGGILETITERTEPDSDQSYAMDITTAVGTILPADLKTNDKSVAKQLMEEETDSGQLRHSPLVNKAAENAKSPSPIKPKASIQSNPSVSRTSDVGSPIAVTAQMRRSSRKSGGRVSTTPKKDIKTPTPVKKPATPSKQLTPRLVARPTTPSKTPPAKNVTMRAASPKKLFKAEIERLNQTPKPTFPTLNLDLDASTTLAMPSMVTPQRRRSSGVGIDREGLGSPRVAAILDRRTSIGEQAQAFTPQLALMPNVRFADPRAMEEEVERERAQEGRRESGHDIMEWEDDFHRQDTADENVTANLRDMIQSMTPKKGSNKLKGRKSLAVGGAKGILGKRPAELDEDEEEDDDHTPKRLKGRERSPVKNVRLPAPPSKAETTGRLSKPPRFSLGPISANTVQPAVSTPSTQEGPASPQKPKIATPRNQERFKDVSPAAKSLPQSFEAKLAGEPVDVVEDAAAPEEKIHLQDFLNMTSIRFMELTTTKRRHTVAPRNEDSIRLDGSTNGPGRLDDRSLESCVVAGACTVPMLELYQHSCHELKNYLSTGRSILRAIEADTYEDQPPLFQEYLSATPSLRTLMDTQFKNVKTHARLRSREMWYEWRSKLLDGLMEGLAKIGEGLVADETTLKQMEELLQAGAVVKHLLAEKLRLEEEVQRVGQEVEDFKAWDDEELVQARADVASAEDEIARKWKEVEELREAARNAEEELLRSEEQKTAWESELLAAEKFLDARRAWSADEVARLKESVAQIEGTTGWTIVSAAADERSITLAYQTTLHLSLSPSSFARPNASPPSPRPGPPSQAITLTYHPPPSASPRPSSAPQLSQTQSFVLSILSSTLNDDRQRPKTLRDALNVTSASWDLACSVHAEVDALTRSWITDVVTSDTTDAKTIGVTSFIIGPMGKAQRPAKIEVDFTVGLHFSGLEEKEKGAVGLLRSEVTKAARLVYGEGLPEEKRLVHVLQGEGSGELGRGRWAEDVRRVEGAVRGGRRGE